MNDQQKHHSINEDAKPKYEKDGLGYRHQDIRQVSGYARLEETYKTLKVDEKKLIGIIKSEFPIEMQVYFSFFDY